MRVLVCPKDLVSDAAPQRIFPATIDGRSHPTTAATSTEPGRPRATEEVWVPLSLVFGT